VERIFYITDNEYPRGYIEDVTGSRSANEARVVMEMSLGRLLSPQGNRPSPPSAAAIGVDGADPNRHCSTAMDGMKPLTATI
jgi:hypothetical protein